MRILLIRLRLIGDVVLTTPAVRALRRTYPDARLVYLVEPLAAPVVQRNPHLDEVIVAPPRRRGVARLVDDVALAARLRRARFDLVVDFHGGPRSSWLTLATGAPRRIGYAVPGRSWMYTDVVDRPRGLRRRHSVENQWDLLAPIGSALAYAPTPASDPVEMPASPAAEARVQQRLARLGLASGGPLVIVHVGAGNDFRRWPASSFAELVAGLSAADPTRRIILTAGASEAAQAATVAADAARRLGPTRGHVATASDLDLDELHALVGGASVFIGNDSGPMHLAATTDIPIVAIFGPTLPDTWAPWRDPARPSAMVLGEPLPCRPCAQRVCEPGDFRCLTRLGARPVLDAAERLLAGCARRAAASA